MKKKYILLKTALLLIMFTTQFYGQASSGQSKIVYVDDSKTDNTGNGLTWSTAKKDLQIAINLAASGDRIWIKAGIYYPNSAPNMTASTTVTATSPLSSRDNYILLKDGVQIYGGFAGTETLLSQRDIATNVTYIDGDIGTPNDSSDNCYHLMIYIGTYSSTGITLDGMVFRNANAQRAAASTDVFESTTIAANSYNNGVQRRLAGVYIQQGLNNVFNNLVFENNTAENRGAGLYTYGGYGTTCTYTVSNSYFVNNLLTQSAYGAWAADEGKVNSYNNVFYGNKVANYQYGDGVALFLNRTQNSIINCSFIKNESYNGAAVGVIVDAALATNFSNCIFYGTSRNASFADTKKYDIQYNNSSYSLTLKNCSLEHAQTTYITANNNSLSATSSGNIFAQVPTFSNINNVKGADNKYFTSDDGLASASSSACKNTGLNSEIPVSITKDITSANRILSTTVDMGAYEIDGLLSNSNFALNDKFKVYPNPSKSILNIEMTSFLNAKTTVYDLNGRLLISQEIDQENSKINISDLANGIYLLKIDTENGSVTKQIVKE